MWWSIIGFALWVAGVYYSAASRFGVSSDHLLPNAAIYGAVGALYGLAVWFVALRPKHPMWGKCALLFMAIGFPYYFFNTDAANTMLSLVVMCLPAGAIFGSILGALTGWGQRKSGAADAAADRTTQKLEQQRYLERGRD